MNKALIRRDLGEVKDKATFKEDVAISLALLYLVDGYEPYLADNEDKANELDVEEYYTICKDLYEEMFNEPFTADEFVYISNDANRIFENLLKYAVTGEID